jgi:hypothetical protein
VTHGRVSSNTENMAHQFGTGHDAEGTKFILEKTEELQVRGFVLKKFVKIYVNKL